MENDPFQTDTGTQIGDLFTDITNLVTDFGNIIISVAGLVIVLMIIIGGIQYMTGQPDNGKKTITAAIIGAVIIILSTGIIYALIQLLK